MLIDHVISSHVNYAHLFLIHCQCFAVDRLEQAEAAAAVNRDGTSQRIASSSSFTTSLSRSSRVRDRVLRLGTF